MIENTDKVDKPLQSQTNMETQEALPENILLSQRENDQPKQQIKEMEVHHHPKVEKKHLKEYLLEGLMIFIAVTLGFFAESLREHLGDKAKEKEYVSSLARELKYDTVQYRKSLNTIVFLNLMLDSLYLNVKEADKFNYNLVGKWNTPINTIRIDYKPTLATIDQMKSSGSLRLVENGSISNKILEYENFVQSILDAQQNSVLNATLQVYKLEDELCDYTDFNAKLNLSLRNAINQTNFQNVVSYDMPLLLKDPLRLNELANSFVDYKAINYIYIVTVNQAMAKAADLLKEIKNEYNITD
jgi:hypothetical protein